MEEGKHYQVTCHSKPLHLSSAMICMAHSVSLASTSINYLEIHAIEEKDDHLIGIIGTETTQLKDLQSVQCVLNLKLQPTSPVTLYFTAMPRRLTGTYNVAVQITGYYE